MNTDRIIEKAIEEIQNPKFDVTKQFLEIHNIILRDGVPVINRVDLENKELGPIVYFEVEDEHFYFVVYLNVEPEIAVRWTDTEAGYRICLAAGFNELHTDEIIAMTTLTPTMYWNKGDKSLLGSEKTFTKVIYEPNIEADGFGGKLGKLLAYLEQDVAGVKRLVKEANGYIQVAAMFHNGNTMLGSVFMNADVMKRLVTLGLNIDFDIYAEGNFFHD